MKTVWRYLRQLEFLLPSLFIALCIIVALLRGIGIDTVHDVKSFPFSFTGVYTSGEFLIVFGILLIMVRVGNRLLWDMIISAATNHGTIGNLVLFLLLGVVFWFIIGFLIRVAFFSRKPI